MPDTSRDDQPLVHCSTVHGASDILVVDDDPSNLLAIEAALGDIAPLVPARSGPEALRRLLTQDFALILLDVQMPSMDGFQTARLIRSRKRTEHTPIIFVTAHSRDQDEVLKAYALGAVDFLFKPIVSEILQAKVTVLLELQRRTAEVSRQAELLREHEHREHERALAEERRRWQEAVLRQQMDEERRAATETSRRAEELARNVAERARAERELTRINTALAEADRRKDEFLAVLAHELRNPLAPIMTGLDILRLDLPKDVLENTRVRRARDTMERQLQQLCRLVDDLLDVSRINSGKIELRRENVSLSDVVNQALAISAPMLEERRHELFVDIPQQPLGVFGDSVRLTQVIANLLNNAAKYTPPGGRVWLSCEADGRHVLVRVRDNGEGIVEDSLGKIFDVFVQGRSGSGGLGLGLTLVKRLVELHGGTVTAASDGPGKGSEFVVRLELSDTPVPLPAPSDRPPAPQDDRPLRVVVVDDNDDIRATMRDLLETLGHDVVAVASDGLEAVEAVRRCQPDAALVDIDMPRLDGYAVAKMLRSETVANGIRLVAMTGFGQRRDRLRAFDAGFDAHLVKPATTRALLGALYGDPDETDRITTPLHREE